MCNPLLVDKILGVPQVQSETGSYPLSARRKRKMRQAAPHWQVAVLISKEVIYEVYLKEVDL